MCGEIAGDPHFLPLLLSLGVDSLSAAAPLLAELKFFGRQFSYDDALRLLEKVRTCRRPSEINRILKDFYDEKISDLLG